MDVSQLRNRGVSERANDEAEYLTWRVILYAFHRILL
jgi:hypothetical protein